VGHSDKGTIPPNINLPKHDCAWLDFLLRLTYPIINLLLIGERTQSWNASDQNLASASN
jgi:hypothetical protein